MPRQLIAGVDVSTKSIAIVVLAKSDGSFIRCDEFPIPTKAKLNGNKAERCRSIDSTAIRGFLRGVQAVYVEQPMGRFIQAVAEVERVIGAFIAVGIPQRSSVHLIDPLAWRTLNELRRHASKEEITALADICFPVLTGASQDLHDAALIARAGIVSR